MHFERALALDPAHREARLGLAEAHYHEGRPEGSVSILAKMIEENAGDLAAWRAGAVYLTTTDGREAAADAWLEAGLTIFPDDQVLQRMRARMPAGVA